MLTITKENNPELYQELCQNCEIDTSSIPKHGKGYGYPKVTLEDGRKFETDQQVEWDYNWGIEWEYTEVKWLQVEEFENKCPCCGQLIK